MVPTVTHTHVFHSHLPAIYPVPRSVVTSVPHADSDAGLCPPQMLPVITETFMDFRTFTVECMKKNRDEEVRKVILNSKN